MNKIKLEVIRFYSVVAIKQLSTHINENIKYNYSHKRGRVALISSAGNNFRVDEEIGVHINNTSKNKENYVDSYNFATQKDAEDFCKELRESVKAYNKSISDDKPTKLNSHPVEIYE